MNQRRANVHTESAVACSLSDLPTGSGGIVLDSDAECAHGVRLAELGLAQGSRVDVVRCGAPMLLQVGNARLCVRSDVAANITILRDTTESAA